MTKKILGEVSVLDAVRSDTQPGCGTEVFSDAPIRKSASHGEAGYARAARDFYPTEPWVTEALCQAIELDSGGNGVVWEPACGDGRMAKVLGRWHAAVVASDIADYGYGEPGHDFLSIETVRWLGRTHADRIAAIVTNPPFDLAKRFIACALELTRATEGKVAILQRHEFDAPRSNWPLFARPFAMKLILPRRPRWSDGPDKASPRFPYAWYVWDWRHKGEPVIRWLSEPAAEVPSFFQATATAPGDPGSGSNTDTTHKINGPSDD